MKKQLFLGLISLLPLPLVGADSKPNIIFIMADDMGYGDLSCYGSKTIKTPHLDGLAASGVKCIDFHSNGAVCSPTRAALMTGRYQQRSGVEGVITAKSHRETGLPLAQWTLGEAMKEQGYQTALFGKWHLGYQPRFNPVKQGFDEFKGFVSGNVDYHRHIDQEGYFDWWKQDELKDDPGYITDLITRDSLDFIDRNKEKPFFLILHHGAPHYPLQDRETPGFRLIGKDNRSQPKQKVDREAVYAKMIEIMDEGVGQLVAKLDELKLRKNTLFIFCSDNGPAADGSSGGLRGKKGQVFEGGHRVPGIFNWPGKLPSGAICKTPMLTMDLFPTFVTAAKGKVDPKRAFDGVDLLPALRGKEISRKPLFWRHRGNAAVREEDWKLVRTGKGNAVKVMLFELSSDRNETMDLASKHPDRVKHLVRLLKQWEEEVTVAAPEPFDRLTFHAQPKPLSEEAVTEDWPRFLGPRHDLHSKEDCLLKSLPAAGPKLVWEVSRGGGHAPPVVSGDRLVMIHTLEDREVIECLHSETGRRHWKFDYPVTLRTSYGTKDAPRSGPVIDGDLVFSVGVRGDLHCLSLTTGQLVWKKNLDEEYGPAPFFFGRGGCPLVHGDQLIVNVGGQFCVGGFDKRTGKLIWTTKHDWHASYASPVPATIHGKDRVLVFAGGMTDPPAGGLLSIDPKTGKVESAFPWRARMYTSVNAASPVAIGNAAFVTEGYTEGSAMIDFAPDGSTKLRWQARQFGSQFTTPVAHEGYLYGVSGTGGTEMVCYEIATGREMWRDGIALEGARLGRASLLHIDGDFLCLGAQGTLLWLDLSPKGAKILSQTQLFLAPETWGVPVVSRGLLYINQNAMRARLVCYDLRR